MNNKFISIVVPHFGPPDNERGAKRFDYLTKLVESMHKNADYPFEIVIHDDMASSHRTEQLESKVSTIIHNYGLNIGLADSANRCIRVASSDFILFLNDDCVLLKPCFKAMRDVLQRPYVGMCSFYGEGAGIPNPRLKTNETGFYIVPGIGRGSIMAFRKDVFNEIGGFEPIHDGCADTPLIYKILRHGYFRVHLAEETVSFTNTSAERGSSFDSTIGPYRGLFMPRLFNLSDDEYRNLTEKKRVVYSRNEHIKAVEPELLSLHFWDATSKEIVPSTNPMDIRWDSLAAKRFGHTKWKNLVEHDIFVDSK